MVRASLAHVRSCDPTERIAFRRRPMRTALIVALLGLSGCASLVTHEGENPMKRAGKIGARTVLALPTLGMSEAFVADAKKGQREAALQDCMDEAQDKILAMGTAESVAASGNIRVRLANDSDEIIARTYLREYDRCRLDLNASRARPSPVATYGAALQAAGEGMRGNRSAPTSCSSTVITHGHVSTIETDCR